MKRPSPQQVICTLTLLSIIVTPPLISKIELEGGELKAPIVMFETRSALDPLNTNSSDSIEFDQYAAKYAPALSIINDTKACANDDQYDAFSENLSAYVDPTRNCRKIIIDNPLEKKKYCQCLGDKGTRLSIDEMKKVKASLETEAKIFREEIVRANLSAIQDKMLGAIALQNQLANYAKGVGKSCSPEKMIESFNQAIHMGSCGKGKIGQIEQLIGRSNAFAEMSSSFEKFNADTKDDLLDTAKLNADVETLAALLHKFHSLTSNPTQKSEAEFAELKKQMEEALANNPLLRHFRIELPDHASGKPIVINQFKGIQKDRQPNLITDLADILKDKKMDNYQDLKKALTTVTGNEIKKAQEICNEIPSNMEFICERAMDPKYSISLIQNNPVHLAKTVKSIFLGYKVPNLTFEIDSSITGFGTSALDLPKNPDNKTLSEKVDMLQCTFAFKDLSEDLIFASTEKLDPSLYAMADFTHPNKLTIGSSAFVNDLIKEADIFDPYSKFDRANEEQLLRTAMVTKDTKNIDKYRTVDLSTKRRRPSASEMLERTFGGDYRATRSASLPPSSAKSSFTDMASSSSTATVSSSPSSSNSFSSAASQGSSFTNNYQTLSNPLHSQKVTNDYDDDESSNTVKKSSEQSVLDSYEKRLASMMERLEAISAQKKEGKKDAGTVASGNQPLANAAPTAEEVELKGTIAKLKEQINSLQEKQKAIETKKVATAQAAPAQKVVRPVNLAPIAKNQHNARIPTPENTAPASSTARNLKSATNGQTSASGSSFSSTSTGARDFSLRSETLASEGKMVVSAKEFKANDQKFISELYEKAAGQAVYVTQLLPDGSEEIVVYEPTKLPDGTITYVAKKQVKEEKKGDQKKEAKQETKKEEKKEDSKRKRVKVEDLNQLIKTVK